MDEWEYHPPPDIEASIAERLQGFPRQQSMLIYMLRSLAALTLRAWMRVYHRLEIEGRDNLPVDTSCVIVCNHTSHLDTLSLIAAVPLRQIHCTFPAAAADYFFSSLPRSAVSVVFFNALPFDRKAKGADSLLVCGELLKNPGNILIIFPEGTRTTTGEMSRFRSGIGRLVAGTELPVVPCYLDGGMVAWPKGKLLPRPRRLHLHIGQPLEFSQLDGSRESVALICKTLREHVVALGRSGT